MSRRILMVTSAPAYPPHWGAAMRNYQLIKGLAERHHVSLVTLIGPAADPSALPHLREVCERVTAVPLPPGTVEGKRAAQLRSLMSLRSYGVTKTSTPELAATLAQEVETFKPDLIELEGGALVGLRFPTGAPVILDEHNIEYELLARMAAAERSPIRKLYNTAESLKFKASETAAWRRSRAVAFPSDRERLMAQSLVPGVPMATIPNGVDLEHFRPIDEPADPGAIVFTGIQSYRPNVDAALYFGRQILPAILEGHPKSVFWIVGQRPPAETQALAGPNVRVTGWVEDTAPYLARAAVVVAPLRMGGGTRLKILEAMAMGKAVVTTSLGCEGIDVKDGEHLLIADDPREFAAKVTGLCADPGLAASLGRAGRRLVEARYGWRAVVESLDAFHSLVLEDRDEALMAV